MQVLTRCQDLCLRDRTAANNLVRTCSSFDFQPGKRLTLPTSVPLTSPMTSPSGTGAVEYDESVCFLSRELPRPEGLGTLVNLPGHFLYSEVCLSCKFSIFNSLLILLYYISCVIIYYHCLVCSIVACNFIFFIRLIIYIKRPG